MRTFNGGVRSLMKSNKVTTLAGLATITAAGKVSIKSPNGETQEIETKNIVIATGSAPVELPFAKFDGKTIVSSTEALTFTEPPKKLVVIGAGAVGLELGSVWNRLGSEVTVLEFLPRIALGFDLELSNLLQRLLTAQGMTFHLEAKVSAVKVENGRATVSATKDGEQLKVELNTEVEGLDIYYSFDNSIPDRFYPKYIQPLIVPKDAENLKVITYRGKNPIGRQIVMPVAELKKRGEKKK